MSTTPTPPPPTAPAAPASSSRKGNLWMTGVGALAAFGIVLGLNYLAGLTNATVDMTEKKIHSLTEGTVNILKRIDKPITMKLYISPDKDMPPGMSQTVRDTENMINLMVSEAPAGKIKFRKEITEADTDRADDAELAGVTPAQTGINEFVYFGIAISCEDRNASLPWVQSAVYRRDPQTGEMGPSMLEYELARSFTEVMTRKKPKIGIMSPLKLSGSPANPFGGGRGEAPWLFYSELKQRYDLVDVKPEADSIDQSLNVLILVHPAGISDLTQWAVDQYILKGGNVVAFVDPKCITAMQNQNPMAPPTGAQDSSNLEKLIQSWGFTYDASQVVGDPLTMHPHIPLATVLSLDRKYLDKDNPATSDLANLEFYLPGGFTGSAPSNLSTLVLAHTSAKAGLTPAATAMPQGNKPPDYKLSDTKERILAVRLTGKFKTAFPGGKPPPPPPKPEGGNPHGGLPPGFGGPGFGPQGAQGDKGTEAPPANPPAAPAETAPAAPAAAAPPAAPAAPAGNPPAAPTPVPPGLQPPPVPPAAPNTPPPVVTATPPVSAVTPAITIDPANLPPAAPTGAAVPAPAPTPTTPLLPPVDGAAPLPSTGPSTPAAPSLTEAEKEGSVYLVADVDMLANQFAAQEFMGQYMLKNANLSLGFNLVDSAAGDTDLLKVRSRASNFRPFDKIKEIRDNAKNSSRSERENLEKQRKEKQDELDKLVNSTDPNNRENLSLAAKKKQEEFRKERAATSKKLRDLEKKEKAEVDGTYTFIRIMNFVPVPLMIIVAGLAVYFIRRIKTAAS